MAISRSRITSVSFSLTGTTEARADSYVTVSTPILLADGRPQPNGLYDPHMGPPDNSIKCTTCGFTSQKCKGHEGSIILNQPVWNPMGVSECKKWLKLICFNCGKPFIHITEFASEPAVSRLNLAQKSARMKFKKPCVHCGTLHHVIKKDETRMFLIKIYHENDKVNTIRTLLPHEIRSIFEKITDETVLALGKPLVSHPRNFILSVVKVPPTAIRPDVKKFFGGGKNSIDKLTTGFQILIRKNNDLPALLPEKISEKMEASIIELSNIYYGLIRTNADEGASIAQRLTGKKGRFRKNMLGKRTFIIGRDTIAGNAGVGIDWFAIPMKFAKVLQVEEVVTTYNRATLLGYINNGLKHYPGATELIKKNGAVFGINAAAENMEIGDIIMRDLIDGDIAEFNRQPTLRSSNLQAHWIKVIKDESIKVMLLNPISVKPYDGDFDGDEMNIIVSAGLGARCEITKLSSVPNWLISQDNAVPVFGHIEDSIVGIGELTQSHTQLSKYAVCSLYKNCKTLPVLDKETYTGREAASLLFRNTPINYTRASGACPDLFKNYINYLPEDKVISIVNGQIKSGVIEKKSIGSGSPGNIFHTIANDYSPQYAITIMHEMQQVGIAMNSFRNCTLSIADLILPPSARLECEEINSGQLLKSHLINDRLDRGEIVPPIGKTVQQYFEELQIAALSTTDIFVDTIMRHIVPKNGFITNGFLKMILFGSKGSPDNLFNMIAAVGPRLTNGKRPKMDFGYCRAGPHTRRFDQNPLHRDYIQNSYIRGLNGLEYFANARYARYDLILKQLFTSVSGKQSRISAINLESIYVNNLRMAVKSKNIIQFCYGEDCLDTRRIITVKFPTVMISNEAFVTTYKHPQFPAFFAKMQEDRDKYRRIFSRLERFNEKDIMSDERKVSIDVAHIVTNVLNNIYSKPPTREISAADLAVAVAKVEKFCDIFPYLLLNEIQEKRRTAIPDWILAATWLPCMLIRSHLHPNTLAARKITPSILDTILVKIRNVYMCSLIDPGMAVGIVAATSFSAFLTQYIIDAHRRSAEGGTSKSGMHQMKEILAAKEADKLSAPSMLIPVQDRWAYSETAVREIANTLEAMNFVRFVSHYQIFFEKMGEPVHPKYTHEAKDIAEFARLNPLLRVPADLINFCIRYDIIHTEIIFKNISMENIVEKLRQTYPETYIMYTPENSGRLYIRVYMRNSMFKSGVSEPGLISLAKELLTTLIRGINNIKETKLVKLICTKTLEDGSIVRENDKWAIKTVGTNLIGVLQHPQVDTYNVMTEAIQELAEVFGIEAARQKIILGMKNIVQIIHTHYLIYAAEMTFTGRVTNIESTGLKTRSPNSVLLQAGSAGPVQVLEHAAVNGLVDDVTGLTAPMLVGDIPRYGTNYNQIIVNEKFVRDNVKAPDSVFESALA